MPGGLSAADVRSSVAFSIARAGLIRKMLMTRLILCFVRPSEAALSAQRHLIC